MEQKGPNFPDLDDKFEYGAKNIEGFLYTSVACAVRPSDITSSTDFSFRNLAFWNLFEFSAAEII